MTEVERQSLKKIDAKIRNLIAQFRVLQKENEDLYTELESKETEIKTLKEELEKRTQDYKNLKLAKIIEVSDNDLKESKMKITRLVREVNKCINILSAESVD